MARHAQVREQPDEQLDRHLELRRDHLVGAEPFELVDLLHAPGADQDADRAALTCRSCVTMRRVAPGSPTVTTAARAYAAPRLSSTARREASPKWTGMPSRCAGRDILGDEVDRLERDAGLAEHARDRLAGLPEADHEHVVPPRRASRRPDRRAPTSASRRARREEDGVAAIVRMAAPRNACSCPASRGPRRAPARRARTRTRRSARARAPSRSRPRASPRPRATMPPMRSPFTSDGADHDQQTRRRATSAAGSRSMPIEVKKSATKASRSGSSSAKTWWA